LRRDATLGGGCSAAFEQARTAQLTVYAWRGESGRAIEWLERAYRQQDSGLTRLTLDPLLTKLRGDSRFKALVRKMHLPD
jgi:hypothetical protein